MLRQNYYTYKLCNDQSLNEWANTVLRLCVELLLPTCTSNHIDSVILTGSLSRGEASIFLREKKPVLAGDIEFLLVCKQRGKLAKERSFYKSFKKDMCEIVSEKVGSTVDVDIGLVSEDYFTKKIPASIFLYDLITFGKVVAGEDYLQQRKIQAEDIVRDDALALLMNRAIELLILSDNGSRDKYSYQLVKILLDMAGSLLAFTGNYVAPYTDRPEAMKKLVHNGNFTIADIHLVELVELVEKAKRIKCEFALDDARRNEILVYEKQITTSLATLIAWQMTQLVGSSEELFANDILLRYFSCEPFTVKFKEWVKYCIHPFRSKHSLKFQYLPSALLIGSPRNMIYSSAIKCFFEKIVGGGTEFKTLSDLRVFNMGATPGQYCKDACLLWSQVVKHN